MIETAPNHPQLLESCLLGLWGFSLLGLTFGLLGFKFELLGLAGFELVSELPLLGLVSLHLEDGFQENTTVLVDVTLDASVQRVVAGT